MQYEAEVFRTALVEETQCCEDKLGIRESQTFCFSHRLCLQSEEFFVLLDFGSLKT